MQTDTEIRNAIKERVRIWLEWEMEGLTTDRSYQLAGHWFAMLAILESAQPCDEDMQPVERVA